MFDEDLAICNSSNIMAHKLVDYTNDDRHNSYFFSGCSINLTMIKIKDLDR